MEGINTKSKKSPSRLRRKMENIKVMYCMPSKFTKEEPGTIIKVMGDGEFFSLYIQASSSKESPEWIDWGTFLSIALEDKINDPEFISGCLTEYSIRSKKEL